MSTSGATTTTTAYYGTLALSVNGALSYTLADGLGSVSESLNSSGVVTATQLYSPYGALRYSSGALPTSYGYTHQRSDAVSGLDYYGARYYDPMAGQFTSADTLLPKSVAQPDPHQLNRYMYVGDNPETKTDPTGHCPWCIAVGVVLGVVVASASVAQAAHDGDLNSGTFVRAGADMALGIGAGVALTADPEGGLIGLGGAIVGIAVQTKVSGKFDYQSAFETAAAGTITGALGGVAFNAVAGVGGTAVTGTASLAKLAGQAAVQGTINGASDLSLQALSHASDMGAGRRWSPDWGEASIAFGFGAIPGFLGEYSRGIGVATAIEAPIGGGATVAANVGVGAYSAISAWSNQTQARQHYEQQYSMSSYAHGRAPW